MTTPLSARSNGRIACIGGAVMNRKYRAGGAILAGTSNPASMHTSFGGVARNVAETLARLGLDVSLISVLGEDASGRALRDCMVRLGVDMHATRTLPSVPTADYAAVLTERGELHVAMAAMDAFDAITPDHLETVWPEAATPPWTFADCNLPASTLDALMRRSRAGTCSLAVDTVSVPKAVRLPGDLSGIDLLFTNMDEARALLDGSDEPPHRLACALRGRGVNAVVVTMGADGHVLDTPHGRFHTPAAITEPADVTGAGDALISGTLFGLMHGRSIVDASRIGALLARLTIGSKLDVLPELSAAWLETQASRLGLPATRKLGNP